VRKTKREEREKLKLYVSTYGAKEKYLYFNWSKEMNEIDSDY